MPTTNGGMFEYPEEGWSTGKMRKFGDPVDAAGAMSDSPVVETIEKLFQGRKEAMGQYDTVLSAAEEEAFQKWKKKNAPNDSGQDYDLRGAFKAGLTKDPETGHWPDLYKKPNHPTFSDQSIYAKDAPEKAGRWEGGMYVPPAGRGRRSESGMMRVAKRTSGRTASGLRDLLDEAGDRRSSERQETKVY